MSEHKFQLLLLALFIIYWSLYFYFFNPFCITF
jgi:hypothetical protein